MKVYNGKLYLTTGSNYTKIFVVDLETDKVVSIIDAYSNGIEAEAEGISIYKEKMLLIQSNRNVYALEF
jgi:hypothetical protein